MKSSFWVFQKYIEKLENLLYFFLQRAYHVMHDLAYFCSLEIGDQRIIFLKKKKKKVLATILL